MCSLVVRAMLKCSENTGLWVNVHKTGRLSECI